jgi:hypothetical protein
MATEFRGTYEVRAPIEKVWAAFTESEGQELLWANAATGQAIEFTEREEHRLVRWVNESSQSPDRHEFTIRFESIGNHVVIHLLRVGFGEGDAAEVFGEAHGRGWDNTMTDLVAWLETGVPVQRHIRFGGRSCTGIAYVESETGVIVCDLVPGGFGDQAGLQRGDLIVSVGGAPIFGRGDLWLLTTVLEPGSIQAVEYVRDGVTQLSEAPMSTQEHWAVGELS